MTATVAPPARDPFVDLFGPLRLPAAYCPHFPHVKQEWFLRRPEFESFFGGAAGPGKALSLDTPLPTPSGWTTMGEVREGDVVLDRAGVPTLVLAVSEVMAGRDVYRVRFSDGAEIVADGSHLWETMTATEREQSARRDPAFRAKRRASRPSRATGRRPHVAVLNRERDYDVLAPPEQKTRTTRQIAATLEAGRRRNHSVALHAGLDLPARDLPLDPYVLGLWLGDGNTRDGHITTADPEVIAEVVGAGFGVRPVPSAQYGYRVVGLTAILRSLGLVNNKHVPAVYLRASAAQRLALLQGLMDSDGTADTRGDCEFASTLPNLAEAVAELVLSLGGLANVRAIRTRLAGVDCGPGWRVSASLYLPMFRLFRKADRQRLARSGRSRYIVAVEPVPSVPVRCIRTSASTYLAGRQMIATHNSWGLLMAALQYVDVPGYDALLLRPTLGEFTQPGGLIEVAHEWLGGTDAYWHGGERKWTFPSGATLRFGYLKNVADLKQYKGPSFSFVGFDELTSFPEALYRGTFRLLRQAVGGSLANVPLRMRSASNPGDIGHQWVKARFIQPETRDPAASYVRATIHDNPFMDYATYLLSLSHMDPVDQLRLINGDWDVMEEGGKFARPNLLIVPAAKVAPPVQVIRYWDLAATEVSATNKDPDYTVGLLLEMDADGLFTVRDIARGQWADAAVENAVVAAAEADTARYGSRGVVTYYIEQEPGASGKLVLSNFTRKVLAGYSVYKGLPRGDKEVRSRPVAAAVANRLVRFVESCPNLREAMDELVIFPNGVHDDVVDALSGAHAKITVRGGQEGSSTVPPGRIPGVESRPPSPGAVPMAVPVPRPVPRRVPAADASPAPAPAAAPGAAQTVPAAPVARVPTRRPPGRIA